MATLNARKGGVELNRVLDLQKEWQQLTGQETARIPQAGFVVVNSSQLDKGVVEKFQQNLTDAVKWINDNPEEAGSLVEKHFDWMKAPAVQQSLQFARLELVPAADCQKEIEAFYTELSKTAPAEALGGKLPDAGFYFQP
jgi:NitT/TauT family transport system substrate-binding protein